MFSNTTIPRQALCALTALLGLLLVTSACGGGQSATEESTGTQAPREPRARWGNLSHAGFRAEGADINRDGTDDQYSYFDGSRLAWVERDFDFDGQREMFEYYGPSGDVVEQEFQLDFDDAIDVVRFYEGGVLVRKEMSTDFSGQASLIKFYDAHGNVLRVERDNDGDATTDIWEYYEDGELARIGRDADGDGSPEILEEPEQ
jgi:hypothetical protein